MHDVPDTEDADQSAERYWSDGFKDFIRTRIAETFRCRLRSEKAFLSIYEMYYTERFDDYDSFVDRLSEMLVIGAENGADQGVDEVQSAFHRETPLPEPRPLTRYLWPEPVDDDAQQELHDRICAEYRDSHSYIHAYEDHYTGDLDLNDFVDHTACLIIVGIVNGSDAMLGNIYRALLSGISLPTPRRRPKLIHT